MSERSDTTVSSKVPDAISECMKALERAIQEQMKYRNPIPTVDIIIELPGGVVLIERKNPPYGWAIPGGYLGYSESLEECAAREAKEETSLDVRLKRQFHTYSDPHRDARHHSVSTVFIAAAEGAPKGADDAKSAKVFNRGNLPDNIAFDHRQILEDYFSNKY